MMRMKFPPGVAEVLKWYVYRLIDPRNGETFYVGKGRGDRIFAHAKGSLLAAKGEDASNFKFQRIKYISTAGLDVAHVIHRHNIEKEDVAFQIEAALIDAYPGLSNKVSGHGARNGCRHVEDIISEYDAQPFEARERLILISIGKSYEDEGRDIYDAVRAAWVINVSRAKDYKLVLAHRRGLVIGAFRPTTWLPGIRTNFPWLPNDWLAHEEKPRWGFVGEPAEKVTASLYLKGRVPDRYRVKGASFPIRYVEPKPLAVT